MTSILFRNGFIHSPADSLAEALLIEDGVIAWLGAEDTADGFASRADKVIDLNGALVAPGFVDSHVHLLETALAAQAVDVSPAAGGHSAERVLDLLADRARQWTPEQGALCATGYDDSGWAGPKLTQDDLDRVFVGVHLYVPRTDLHSGLVSSALLKHLDIDRGLAPQGIVADGVHMAVRVAIRDLTSAQREVLYTRVLKDSAAKGIVSVHENAAPGIDTRAGLNQLLELAASPDSGLPHVVGYWGELMESADHAAEVAATIGGLSGFAGDLSVDGSFGSHSAALRAPYADAPQTSGTLHFSVEQLTNHIEAVSTARLAAGFHVIGDRGLDTVLSAFDAAARDPAMRTAIRRAGHRLEHVEIADQDAINKFIEYGIGLSVQPAFDAFWGGPGGLYESRLGLERTKTTTPLHSFLSAGIPTGFGSDSPVTPIDPWGAVTAALFHNNADHRISARSAFRAHTRGAWRIAGFNSQGEGDIRIGSPADLAIWQCAELGVQAENSGRSSWTTDVRSGSPLLPILGPDAGPITCAATYRKGKLIHTQMD